jgi:hypothetical protein
MRTEAPLLLDLDESNLAHLLSALTLVALAERVEGQEHEFRRCWWTEAGAFAIQSEHSRDRLRTLLFDQAFMFLKGMKWQRGLGGVAHGVLVSGNELGVNPFIGLTGNGNADTPLKGFSGQEKPAAKLQKQQDGLVPANGSTSWLDQLCPGVGSWGFDCRVNVHASDAGISSDAEGTGDRDPSFPATELLGLAAAAFFVPCHAWQTGQNTLHACTWTRPIPLAMAGLAATGCIQGLPGRSYRFTRRGAAHGKGRAYHFFPPATLEETRL